MCLRYVSIQQTIQYSICKISDIACGPPFWTVLVSWYPHHGYSNKGDKQHICLAPLSEHAVSIYVSFLYTSHNLICQSCILINPCRIPCGQRERKLDEPHICVLRSPVYNAAIANIQLPDQLTFPNRYV